MQLTEKQKRVLVQAVLNIDFTPFVVESKRFYAHHETPTLVMYECKTCGYKTASFAKLQGHLEREGWLYRHACRVIKAYRKS